MNFGGGGGLLGQGDGTALSFFDVFFKVDALEDFCRFVLLLTADDSQKAPKNKKKVAYRGCVYVG